MRSLVRGLCAALLAVATAATPAQAIPATTSEIVVDSTSGATLYADDADRSRPPASLAKMMTLLLAFDALRDGELRAGGTIRMTARGAVQQPSRLGLRQGGTIGVRAALRAIAVISANDVAMALAERIGGSEAGFVRMMNARAAEIGMDDTRFGNPTGLSPTAGRTTARDMATLVRYILRTYPSEYSYFKTRSISWGGATRPNHNHLLGKVRGLDGVKTGYTADAGFHLAASSRRGAKRVVVVVMGARSVSSRDLLVSNLIESGFSNPRARRRR